MSKKAIICTIMALSLILMGTAYAYWTDALNVTTKATTGDLDVTFVDLGLYAQYGNEYNEGNWSIVDGVSTEGYIPASFFARAENYNLIAAPGSIEAYKELAKGYNNVDFNATLVNAAAIPKMVDCYTPENANGSDQIVLEVYNMYPGYAQAFRTDIANVGTLAAKLGNILFDVSSFGDFSLTEETKNMLGIAVLVEREYQSDSEEGYDVFQLCKSLGLSSADVFTVGGVDFLRLSALTAATQESVMGALAENNLLALPSKNRMDLYIGIAMDPDAEGVYTSGTAALGVNSEKDALSQNKGAQITIDLLWDQFNAGVDADTSNRLAEQNR